MNNIEVKANVLSNGAVELLRKPSDREGIDVVLCTYEGHFVTWNYYKSDGLCRSGDYYGKDLDGALKSFKERV